MTRLRCTTLPGGGSAVVVEELLKNGSDAMAKDRDQNTALHIASQMRFSPVVQLLINKSDINAKGFNDLTPLHFAAMSENKTVVKLLEDANTNAKDNKIGWTPLHCAADSGDPGLVELLIERGAAVDQKDDRVGWTPLHFAAMHGDEAVVVILLNSGADKMLKDNYGWTPRHFAEINEHIKVAELLYSKGSKGEDAISVNEDFWTSLHCKSINNERGIVKMLVDKKTDVYSKDNHDGNPWLDPTWTPLGFAIGNSLDTATTRLLNKGAHIAGSHRQLSQGKLVERVRRIGDAMQITLNAYLRSLRWATEYRHRPVTRQLLRGQFIMESAPRPGPVKRTLHFSLSNRPSEPGSLSDRHFEHKAIVLQLAEWGIDQKLIRSYTQTPLHWAAEQGDETSVRLLLQEGADKEAKDSFGFTPLHWAAGHGYEVVTQLLLQEGADREAQDMYGGTPLYWAAKFGHGPVVWQLLEADPYKNLIYSRIPVKSIF